ncbi:hypothetical protein PsorP6_007450 [Peronosclerospora sorghi]|uniref:Uncharacterized protein n=1 Tax=Peronosclerospora sorghi TaxID=230839 RepID=A0ACC0W718_9STRA|nr:hypothetical protein PsorP6_007450 [Peronosclerospora sorghi]
MDILILPNCGPFVFQASPCSNVKSTEAEIQKSQEQSVKNRVFLTCPLLAFPVKKPCKTKRGPAKHWESAPVLVPENLAGYLTEIQDVVGDGNYGYRGIATA